MALKYKLNQDEFDKLSDALKEHYKKKGDDYALDAEENEDAAAELRRANERLKEEKRAEKEAKEAALKKLESVDSDKLKSAGDIDALERSWKEKSAKDLKAVEDQRDALREYTRKALIDAAVVNVASKLTEHTGLIKPHLTSRFDVDFGGEAPVLKVLGADGKPSALTTDDLEKEFLQNEEFASIITKSKASGGGASKSSQPANGTGGANLDANGKQPDLSKASPADMVARIKANKETQG